MGALSRWALQSGWTAENTGYSWFTLHFTEHGAERVFLLGRRDALIRKTRILVLAILILSVCTLCVDVLVSEKHLESSFKTLVAYQSSQVSLFFLGVLSASLVLFLAAFQSRTLTTTVSPAVLEVTISALVTVSMVATILTMPAYVTRMQGHSVEEAFPGRYFSDSMTLLLIDGAVTISHLVIPVRWCSLFPMEVAGVSLQAAIAMLIGPNEPIVDSMLSLAALTALVVAASLGKRFVEIGERQAFMDLIKEKSLRCEAEFELARLGSQKAVETTQEILPESQSRVDDSCASHSGTIWDRLYEDEANLARPLARLAKLGDEEHWRIDQKQVHIMQDAGVLGRGSFGVVRQGVFCGIVVAVKQVRSDVASQDDESLADLGNELRILRHLRHPNIVGTHGAVVDTNDNKIILVLEFVDGMTLAAYMARKAQGHCLEDPSLLSRYQIMVGVCRALMYMHTRHPSIVHGDLKSANIMLEVAADKVHPKLLDFGLSRVTGKRARPLGGTMKWMAPEVSQMTEEVKCSADVYSFGHLITLVAAGIEPSEDMSSRVIRWTLERGTPHLPNWPQDCPLEPTCRPLACACLRANELDRLRIVDVFAVLLRIPHELELSDGPVPFLREVGTLEALMAKGSLGQLPQQHSSANLGADQPVGPPSLLPEDATSWNHSSKIWSDPENSQAQISMSEEQLSRLQTSSNQMASLWEDGEEGGAGAAQAGREPPFEDMVPYHPVQQMARMREEKLNRTVSPASSGLPGKQQSLSELSVPRHQPAHNAVGAGGTSVVTL